MDNKGFTLIELIVVIAIIATLSGIILFSITQYINKGKDSNVYGNLAVLVPAGEVWYNANGDNYDGFCDSDVVKNAKSQMPVNPNPACPADLDNPEGVCCHAESQAWAACANEFSNARKAYCVDSRGMKKEIDTDIHPCNNSFTQCP
jgi:prepilin-type N-terminal cleavage/methylation domain-containing protein